MTPDPIAKPMNPSVGHQSGAKMSRRRPFATSEHIVKLPPRRHRVARRIKKAAGKDPAAWSFTPC
jgi:hypothetical protein